jgi:hypothetical protein
LDKTNQKTKNTLGGVIMKDVLKSLAKWFGIVVIVLFALWMVSLIWNGVKTCPACSECSTGDGWTKIDTNTDDNVSVGDVTLGEESACHYAEGFDSRGQVVPAGTKVTGPAVVKPSRDNDHALVINVGVEYTTTETDEVVWVFVGDNACALSNAEPYHSTYEIYQP